MANGKEWTEADFKDYQSGKRLQEKINCMNALTAYRLELKKLEKLGLLKRR